MDDPDIWFLILIFSLSIGYLKFWYSNINFKSQALIYNINEFFNHLISIFLSGVLIYYLIDIRYIQILLLSKIEIIDIVTIILIWMCLLGWFPYFIKNITEGISVVFKKFLD